MNTGSLHHLHAPGGALILTTPQELERLIYSSVARALVGFGPAGFPPEGESYLTISEAAAYLNLARQTLYGFTSNRTIPFIKKARRLLFLKSDLDRWLAEGRNIRCLRFRIQSRPEPALMAAVSMQLLLTVTVVLRSVFSHRQSG